MPPAETDDHRLSEAHRLGDLVNGHPEQVEMALPQLLAILSANEDPHVTRAVVDALGHAWHPTAAAALLDRLPVTHPDADVRLALAQALPGGVVNETGDLQNRVVSALVELTRDLEPGVRDWAAFGLGQLQHHTPQALDTLAALLDDPDRNTRCEALVALATAGDARALPVLHRRLADDDGDITRLELQAAAALAAPDLHPALQRLAHEWTEDDDEFTDLVIAAVARTAPDAAGTAQRVERLVLDEVRKVLPVPADVCLTGTYPHTTLVFTDHRGLDLPLWAELEQPETYPVDNVLNAVRGSLISPSQ